MNLFVVRAFSDGTDFLNHPKHFKKTRPARRQGFGDTICELSNLYHHESGHVLAPRVASGFKELQFLFNKSGDYTWEINPTLFNEYKDSAKDFDEFEEITGRKTLMCYSEFDEYMQFDKKQFKMTQLPDNKYVTIDIGRMYQGSKCRYNHAMLIEMLEEYKEDYSVVDVGNSNNLYETAYLIEHAEYHVGIDSGMTHFALCIKDKAKVPIYVPEDRITGNTYRWLNKGYNVKLMDEHTKYYEKNTD